MARKRQNRKRVLARKLIRAANICLVLVVIAAAGVGAGIFTTISQVLPSSEEIATLRPSEGTKVVSAEGKLIARVFEENREFVPITQIPRNLQLAAVAAEDTRFYTHPGVDFRGIARAALYNLQGGRFVQGGSTITQQLARNIYLTHKKTISRKLQEIVLALEIERRYSKEEILEFYLNQIYFGCGAYGVQTAAKTFFGKPVDKLNLAQCALLAGLPQRPLSYDPYEHPKAAQQRRNQVIDRMRKLHYISKEEAESAKSVRLKLARRTRPKGLSDFEAPYFTSYVLRQMVDKYGVDAVYKGGLNIYTTINLEVQHAAEQALRQGVHRARGLRVSQGALIALDPQTGAIKAMVGGVDYEKSKYNRTVQGGRQAGSAFKPFVYTAAMDNGFTPSSVIKDEPVSYVGAGGKRWSPRNYGGGHRGSVTLRTALTHSINVVAVKLMDQVGPETVIRYAHRMGIKQDLDPYLSLALGCSDVTPLEMASAFGVLANNGRRVEPYAVQRVVDSLGNVLEEHTIHPHRVLSEETAQVMTDLLTNVIRRGTGTRARIPYPASGKTGTTSDWRDAWFVGYTPELACAVWVGNDNYSPMRGVCGGTVPAPIWRQFMRQAMQVITRVRGRSGGQVPETTARPVPAPSPPQEQEEQPESATFTRTICADSGLLATKHCPNPVKVTYVKGELPYPPTASCNLHTGPKAKPAKNTVTLSICATSGKLATRYCPNVITKAFEVDKAPSETCDIHQPKIPRRRSEE